MASVSSDYINLGNDTFVRKDLVKSFERKNDFGDVSLALANGMVVNFNPDMPSAMGKSGKMTIDEKDGTIIFNNFNKQWATVIGTDGDDRLNFVNSSQVTVHPGKGKDNVAFDSSVLMRVYYNESSPHQMVTVDGKSDVDVSVNKPARSRQENSDGKTVTHYWFEG